MDPSREKLEELMRDFGFEEKEAAAYWHIQRAHKLFSELRQADREQEDAEDINERVKRARRDSFTSESMVLQHFRALVRELALRVLRRHYPEGWGRGFGATTEEEHG